MRFFYFTCIVALVGSTLYGAQIDRPTKTCGERTYVEEKVLGCEIIKSAEVDDDFNTIYDEFNGGIDNENIAAGANIDCAKVLPGSCGSTILGPDSVCTANIAAGCIVNADINAAAAIAGSKLAIGASIVQVVSANASTSVSAAAGGGEFAVATTPALATTRTGARIIIDGNVGGSYIYASSATTCVIVWRVRRTSIAGTIVKEVRRSVVGDAIGGAMTVVMEAPLFTYDTPAVGAHVYVLSVEVLTCGTFVTTTDPGTMWVTEMQ